MYIVLGAGTYNAKAIGGLTKRCSKPFNRHFVIVESANSHQMVTFSAYIIGNYYYSYSDTLTIRFKS